MPNDSAFERRADPAGDGVADVNASFETAITAELSADTMAGALARVTTHVTTDRTSERPGDQVIARPTDRATKRPVDLADDGSAELVAVPGGAGFVGSHLCERLLERGHRVLVLDDFSTGDAQHLAALREHPRFTLARVDIAQAVPTQLDDARQIFNLACPASPAYYQREPVQTTLTSALGAWRLLESATRSGARLLQASTSEVYGDPQVHPQTEDYWGHVNPIGERSCYDEGKRCAEAMCFAYHRQRRVDIRVARLFNCYGPRLRPGDGRVVSNFIVQALRGEPLTVYGDGQQTRSFCYVDDTVDGLMRLMQAPVDVPVNLGSPVEHTVLELAEKVLRLTGSRSPLRRLPLPPDDPQRRRPDITRARQLLGWAPRVALDDGLRATIDYFRRELMVSARVVSLPM